jgi:hypothetical protein
LIDIRVIVQTPSQTSFGKIWYELSHIVACAPALIETCKLSLDEMNVDPKEDKHNYVFAQHTVDMVYSSYAAAKSRLRLYAHLTNILQQEVDEWAQKVERVGVIIPGYKPVGWLELAASGSA